MIVLFRVVIRALKEPLRDRKKDRSPGFLRGAVPAVYPRPNPPQRAPRPPSIHPSQKAYGSNGGVHGMQSDQLAEGALLYLFGTCLDISQQALRDGNPREAADQIHSLNLIFIEIDGSVL